MVIDYSVAFMAIIFALPATFLLASFVAFFFAFRYWQNARQNRPGYTNAEVRSALGDPLGTGDVLTAIRDLAQKAKDKEADAKAKTEAADQAAKDLAEANATLAKYRTRAGKLMALPSTTDEEALALLDAAILAGTRIQNELRIRSNGFLRAAEADESNRGFTAKTILDLEAVTVAVVHDRMTAIEDVVAVKDSALRKKADAEAERDEIKEQTKLQIERMNGRVTSLQKEIDDLHTYYTKVVDGQQKLNVALKSGNMKSVAEQEAKIAALSAEKAAFGQVLELQNRHNGQVVELATAAIATKAGGNNRGNNNGGNNDRNRERGRDRTRNREADETQPTT